MHKEFCDPMDFQQMSQSRTRRKNAEFGDVDGYKPTHRDATDSHALLIPFLGAPFVHHNQSSSTVPRFNTITPIMRHQLQISGNEMELTGRSKRSAA